MKRFTQLFTELDQTNRTSEKVSALVSYFTAAEPVSAAWALYFLSGRRLKRMVTTTALQEWATEESELPTWLVQECYHAVGDLAETLALILSEKEAALDLSLHDLIEQRLLPLRDASEPAQKQLVVETWREMGATPRFLYNKLLTGGFRVGVSHTLVTRALAMVAAIEPAIMAHRLLGRWQPTEEDYRKVLQGEGLPGGEPCKPYPFFLASPLERPLAELGELDDWQAEWKWDGIRAQLIRRQGEVVIWTRGDEMVMESFPEIVKAGDALPDGTVLDGEILAWQGDAPEPFSRLQRRLGRKTVTAKMRRDFPVVFLAYDLLEWKGEDWRPRPLAERRHQLEIVLEDARQQAKTMMSPADDANVTPDLFMTTEPQPVFDPPLRLSPLIDCTTWEELALKQQESRGREVEGIMLKRRASSYGVGRLRGDWWKWKIDPLVIDAVLVNAQLGHGRRASLYTDYTFGLWHEGKLLPVAKAYSGLTDAEILEVDAFVRTHTTGKFGPIRAVEPLLVFELAFEAVQESMRHKAGLAVRFPRMNRWRRDKQPEDADTLDNLRRLLRQVPLK
jgi:DNA ligase-1